MNGRSRRQAGFAIVSAIFILVVLAVLGAAMVSISTSQQTGSAQDIQGARAYQAARAGLEWGLYKVQSTAAYNFGYTSSNPNDRRCQDGTLGPSTTSFQPAASTLSGFTVTVTCRGTTDGAGGPTVFSVVATACSTPSGGACPNSVDPGALYVERRIAVNF